MRIAISGTANVGKSTFIKDFIKKWPNYSTPKKTYRHIIEKDKSTHSSNTTKETQKKILDFQLKQLSKYNKKSNVIFDRCPLDNLVYSMWAMEKGVGGIDEKFIDECIPLVCESMRNLDIIFFVPLTDAAPIEIVDDGVCDVDEMFIREIDNIFKAMMARYMHRAFTPFFPEDDVPALIEIFGTPRERLYLANMYIDIDGDAIDGNMDELLQGQIQKLIEEQKLKAASDGQLIVP